MHFGLAWVHQGLVRPTNDVDSATEAQKTADWVRSPQIKAATNLWWEGVRVCQSGHEHLDAHQKVLRDRQAVQGCMHVSDRMPNLGWHG